MPTNQLVSIITGLVQSKKAPFIIFILFITLTCNKQSETPWVKVTTSGMKEITSTSITISGEVTGFNSGDTNNETGVCISTSIDASINDMIVIPQISYTSQFDVEVLNLTPNTTYYAKAFFKNLDDVYYGYELKFTTLKHGIGELKEGGIVFWIDPTDSLHGLVCTDSNLGNGNVWGTFNYNVPGANGTAVGSGYQNTNDMQLDPIWNATPSDICLNLTLNGYDDWYLPSKDELYIIFSYSHIIGLSSTASPSGGSGLQGEYWSSSQYDDENAWSQSFYDGGPTISPKNQSKRTRAIRAF